MYVIQLTWERSRMGKRKCLRHSFLLKWVPEQVARYGTCQWQPGFGFAQLLDHVTGSSCFGGLTSYSVVSRTCTRVLSTPKQ